MRRMLKAFLRLLAMSALSVAVIMAVLDMTRSIAAEELVWTRLGASWAALSPSTLAQAREAITQGFAPVLWNPIVTGVLELPGFAVFAAVALLLALAGSRRGGAKGRFAA